MWKRLHTASVGASRFSIFVQTDFWSITADTAPPPKENWLTFVEMQRPPLALTLSRFDDRVQLTGKNTDWSSLILRSRENNSHPALTK